MTTAKAISLKMQKLGRKGALALNSKLTSRQRRNNARTAAAARWAKYNKKHRKAA